MPTNFTTYIHFGLCMLVCMSSCEKNRETNLQRANFSCRILSKSNTDHEIGMLSSIDIYFVNDLRGDQDVASLQANCFRKATIEKSSISEFFKRLSTMLKDHCEINSTNICRESIHVILIGNQQDVLGQFELRRSNTYINKGFLKNSASVREIQSWAQLISMLDDMTSTPTTGKRPHAP